MKKFTVGDTEGGGRLDKFVSSKIGGYTRSALSRLFDMGLVKINDELASPSDKARVGDKVVVDDKILNQKVNDINLPVIYEDEDVVVIDKPESLLTHSKGGLDNEPTVASFIKLKITDIPSSNRSGIVHRLDRATSGVIITAKNTAAVLKLQKQFSKRKVHKTYQAIVYGVPKEAEAIIDAPILRNPAKPQTFKVDANGKTATTRYEILQTFTKNNSVYSLLKLSPTTGRTHQLRVHLAYIGHPIVGDPVYGKEKGNLMLHATELEITLPSGVRKKFESRLPERFKEFING